MDIHTYLENYYTHNNVLSKIKAQLVSLRFYFLFFWAIGMIVPVWIGWNDQQGWVSRFLAVIFIFIAICIKIKINYKLVNFKEFLKMQGDFLIPYAFSIISIVLWCTYNQLMNQNNLGRSNTLATTHSILYALIAFCCSLLMNPKTNSKVQYWVFMMTLFNYIAVQTARLIINIDEINSLMDNLTDEISMSLQNYITLNTQNALNSYNQLYALNSTYKNTFVSAKDYVIFLIVSVIAEILVLMDLIIRPIQKKEQMIQEDEEQNQFELEFRQTQINTLK